jgi:hypothetical protein
MSIRRDFSLDGLIAQDGDIYFVDDDGQYWVKFRVKAVPVTAIKPHGLDYSLTLHGPDNRRIAGFDNAHPAPRGLWTNPFDHFHRNKTVKPYDYRDAAALIEAFWKLVDEVLAARGIKK